MRSAGTLFPVLLCLLLGVGSAHAAPGPAQEDRTKGVELLRAKDYQGAASALERAVSLAPDDAEAWIQLGSARIGLEQFQGAAVAFETARRLAPDRDDALYNMAYSYRRAGQHARARDVYSAYLARQPGDADAHYALAESLRSLGDDAGAAREFEAYAATENRPDRAKWIGVARQTAQELRQRASASAPPAAAAPTVAAPAAATPAPASAPTVQAVPTSGVSEGMAKLKAGDFEGARLSLMHARSDDPWIQLARASAELGANDAAHAVEHYRLALVGLPAPARPAAQFGLGEALRVRGDREGALRAYEAVAADPSTPAELSQLAKARQAMLAKRH